MNALAKISFLREEDRKERETDFESPYLLDIRYRKKQWQPGELDALKRVYPWLPEFYFKFIEEFDGLGLAWVVFYGSENTDGIPLKKELEYWGPYMKDQYFPIGKDADGSIYVLNRQGQVCWFVREDFEWEEDPKFIANSLDAFIDECLLGKRYREFNSYDSERSFYRFLVSQGWA